jgi:DNA-binding MarR family transcriptional regulator
MAVMEAEETKSVGDIPRLAELAEFRYQLRTFLSFSETASESFGIAAQQYQLMQVIGAADRQASISYLAERMILRHNSMVELVDRAEKAGLVRRRHDEQDLRRSLVELTPLGWSTLEKLVALHLNQLESNAESLVQALRRIQADAEARRHRQNAGADQ